MSRTACQISANAGPAPRGSARKRANSSAGKGNSGTLRTDHHTVVNDNSAPTMNASVVTTGMPLAPSASLFMPKNTSRLGVR